MSSPAEQPATAEARRPDAAAAVPPADDPAPEPLTETVPPDEEPAASLLDPADAERLRRRWEELQSGFVLDPRASVRQVDELVARTVEALTASFAADRAALEDRWSRGDEVGTEELREAMQRYRAFFRRLLAA